VLCLSRFVYPLVVVSFVFSSVALADEPASPPVPNSEPTYQQLRNIGLSGEAVSVNGLTLHRDAGRFHLRSGTVCFVAPVQGKVTGAVFVGDGNLVVDPPTATERGMLALLSKEREFSENFSQLVLRFTDNTYDEIKKSGTANASGCDASALKDSQNATRNRLRYNLSARILQDLLGTEPGGLFVAFVHGKRYNDKLVFAIDPHGAPQFAAEIYREEPEALALSPEEVEIMTYDDNRHGYWGAFHLAEEYKKGTASSSQKNGVARIEHQQLDTEVEKSAHLNGKASTLIVSQVNGLRVVPLDLYRTLRVQSVTGEKNESLSFIQEDKNEDYQFFVILPQPLAAGQKYTITTAYDGKDAVMRTGDGNYYPVARENWYPNNASSALGDYTAYDLTFRIPKGLQMAATGTMVSAKDEGDHNVSVWKSESPITVAGFNFGKFKADQANLDKLGLTVKAYANKEPPDWVRSLQHHNEGDLPSQGAQRAAENMNYVPTGTMDTTVLNKKALAEGQMAMQLYTDYFGNVPLKEVTLTQQTACTYGQAWPGLVWIPICYYFDTTVRHELGLDFGDRGYWRSVTAHEMAHQWWGHAVGFNSYRDQWMSEGFAELSASLYLQMVYSKEPQKFAQFWEDQHQLLTDRNAQGFRAIDVGSLTLGYRLTNSRTGGVTRRLIYPKGGYVLHMIRMMMWDRKTGDQDFKAMMQDFVKSYSGKAATTEDFKAAVEKHITPDMNVDGNGKMDWFFDEYVYGTALPAYRFEPSFGKNEKGDVLFSFKLTQSSVDDSFRMVVPIYFELADGRTVFLGRARLKGNSSVEQTIPMNGMKTPPKRAMINYNHDVLAE
jgi:hypothetical protein